ncbi:hypothetical protein L288_18545 [Sphingobium quisquiliarum P25]|uniref:Uncharacterized protein n=1 Tax=Sphingobium quisquiliarum P25 TaxID=1329909 RepID=T0GJM2_9SPHN|nr:hypothetical protein [Sphingobium quisquiliarum]EQB00238.1 hypothetical protein L288_18545 [Sphingobium quisquiliarum P25]
MSAAANDKHRIKHRGTGKNLEKIPGGKVPGWGRGNKFELTDDERTKVIRAIRRGASGISIARALRINYRTWQRVKADDEEIASALSEVLAMEEIELRNVLIDKAKEGDVTALMFALKTRHGYRDHGAVNGGDDNRVAIQINLPGPSASLEDYQRMIAVETSDA